MFVDNKCFAMFSNHLDLSYCCLMFAAADVFLWRDKKLSASVLGVATAIWVLFELVEYHFLSLVCHILIFALAALFLLSNAHAFMNK